MVDKEFCMSSYLAFRYIEDNGKQFAEGLHHQEAHSIPLSRKTFVGNAEDTDVAIKNVFKLVVNEKLGILLSGGMDSACLASYMPEGSDAYTFRFLGGNFQGDELERAKYYADKWKLNLHYIDIDWSVVESSVDACMKHKGAPVHSIEPQIYFAAQQAKKDGITMMVIGDGADYVFGGMDGLLGKNYGYREYINRSIYVQPSEVLVSPVNMDYLFERYRLGLNSIDYISFYDGPVTDESYASYENAFETAEMAFVDPYDKLKLNHPLDLDVNRKESKIVIRELFRMKYPEYPVPQKLPMPRPVDEYFKDWEGPKRQEFRTDIDMSKYSGNQKWLMWCLERFMDMIEKK